MPRPKELETTPLLSSPGSAEIDSEANAFRKENTGPTPLPKIQLSCILFILAYEALSWRFYYPFINELILRFNISGGDEKSIGYYAGFVTTPFFLAQCASVFLWARLSDRIGRRPVIMFGLFTGAIATIAFGFSRTLPALILCRVIAGGLNGNMAVLKGMIAEISDDSNQARAYSLTPALFAFAFTIGPLITGNLANPCERFPDTFGDSALLEAYPYLLPSIAIAIFPIIGIVITALFLKETAATVAPSCSKTDETDNCQWTHSSDSRTMLTHDAKPRPSESSLASILTPRVRVAVLNYSTVALISNMLSFIQPLFMATTPKYGGLGLSPSQIGSFLSALGIYNGVVQAIFFPIAHRVLGTTSLFQISLASNIVLFAFWPIISHLAKQTEEVSRTLIGLQIAQLALLPLERMAFSCSNIFLTSAAPTRDSIGSTVGLGQTFAAISRSIGPSLAGALFAVSIEKSILGGDFVYLVLVCIVLVSLVGTLYLPRVVKRASEE
ncbi:MFS general substrate transporter [Sistotremastrum suecicum HHB10207 ss-3]|uniref:MFS general substrate transporter n=1 Tax=Sistotremastrum suecicum HHB10207 ss-3 TaxID=1314776 RepID=A0A165XLC6_9AGAM|nr:MFS general substrate transporter [Sistotremastrum suecicum HHB10207 ss-3]